MKKFLLAFNLFVFTSIASKLPESYQIMKRSEVPSWNMAGCCGRQFSPVDFRKFSNGVNIMWPMPWMMSSHRMVSDLKYDAKKRGKDSKRNQSELRDPLLFSVPLDVDSKIILFWKPDFDEEKVNFRIEFAEDVPNFDWFALGWSDYGDFRYADFCLLWITWDKTAYFQDTNSNAKGYLQKDLQNDCLEARWDGKKRALSFSRTFDTCDDGDYVIEDGTTHILWAYDSGFYSAAHPASAPNKGMIRVELLKPSHASANIPPEARHLTITVDNVHVPGTDTTYWCIINKMPDWLTNDVHHIIRYESKITPGNEGLVHHMEVFYCDADPEKKISSYAGSCFASDRPDDTMVCSKVRAAWAMGAGPLVYPEEAGLPIGGPKSNKYIMLEVHYNNPEMRSDWIDSSGIEIYLTPKLRKYDAAIMELGLEYIDKMAIPPGQKQFQLSGYCSSDCTKIGLPENGIIVFASQLHTHLTGNRVTTQHFRNGRELSNLNTDNHYSTHFQEIRLLKKPVHVKPGDFLITTCDYNTTTREGVTFGGHAITDEMCVNYMHYYPASRLEVCKSSVGTDALANYFKFLKEWENVNIKSTDTLREKYGSVPEWTPARVDFLDLLYKESTISMQCNISDGSRFPGEWDNVSLDVVTVPLPKTLRACPHIRTP